MTKDDSNIHKADRTIEKLLDKAEKAEMSTAALAFAQAATTGGQLKANLEHQHRHLGKRDDSQ